MPSSSANFYHQHCVLVVDDDDEVLQSFADLLGRDGYQVVCASDGKEALRILLHQLPCLMILDLLMPNLDGISVLRQARADAFLADLAVIAVTGSDSERLIEQCEELGVVDFVHKPFDLAEMRFRIRNQIRLHETRERNRQLLQQIEAISTAAQDAIVVLDNQGRVTYWNQAATSIFQYTEQEALGQDLHDLVAPAGFHGPMREAFARFRSTGQGSAIGRTVELVAKRKQGDEFPVELSLSAAQIAGRWCAVGIVRDITERKRTESSLRENEALQRTLLDNLTAGVVIIDSETRVIERMNRAATQLFGGKAEALCGRICHANLCPAQNGACPVLDLKQEVELAERELVRADGSRMPILKSVKRIELDGRQKLLETFVDLSEQKFRDGLYRAIFEHSFDAVMTIHAKTRAFSSANPACVQLFGASSEYDFLLRLPSEYLPELQPDGRRSKEELDRLLDAALADGHVALDWTQQKVDGTTFEASALFVRMRNGTATQVQVIVRDVSEQRRIARQLEEEKLLHQRMEMEVRAAQKLEAIGQLAAGIAHEINTPTQFAGDSVHFLKESLDAQRTLIESCRALIRRFRAGEEPRALVEEFERSERELDLEYFSEQGPVAVRNAIEGISRIAAIVRAMKEFSHPDSNEKCLADLNLALANTLIVARNEYKYVAEVDTAFGQLPDVLCHLGALNQVFLNLIVNAAHAIADKVGNSGEMGRIGIETLAEGDLARIDIWDTGSGIPASLRGRIFEPFFTTKEVGRGTGQGLAIARSIVCGRHGGTIGFESTEGVGTRFIVRIPIGGNAT